MARGHIRQRSPGTWTIQVYLGHDPITGRKRYKSETVRGPKRDAQRRLNEIVYQLDHGSYVEPAKETVGKFLQTWLRDYAEANVRPRTYEGYEGNVRRYIVPCLGSIPLANLTPRHVQSMNSQLLKRGLSPTTAKAAHGALSQALGWGVRMGVLRENVAARVKRPRAHRYQAKVMDWEQSRHYLEVAKASPYYPALLLAITTGLRRSEMAALRWEDISFSSGTLMVSRGLVQLPRGRKEVSYSKSDRRRTIALPQVAVSTLQRVREQREAYLAHAGRTWRQDEYVFCEEDGGPMRPQRFTRASARVVREAGLEGVRLHDLRHSNASLMLWAGLGLKEISELLGHSTITVTADLYAHILPGLARESAAKWDAKFGFSAAEEWQENVNEAADSPETG